MLIYRPSLRPIVQLSSEPKIQILTNISRRITKISSACIEIKIGKNGIFSQLIELINHAFFKSRTSARGQLVSGPIASPHTLSRTPLQQTKYPEVENKKVNAKCNLSLHSDDKIY